MSVVRRHRMRGRDLRNPLYDSGRLTWGEVPSDQLAEPDRNTIKIAMGGVVLGFATVDLSTRDNTLTVSRPTSVQGAADAGHTNAVVFDLDDEHDTSPCVERA